MAVQGGAQDCPYTVMKDMVAGRARLPWEDAVVHTDGQSCGFAAPTRHFIGGQPNLLAPAFDAPPATPLQEAA